MGWHNKPELSWSELERTLSGEESPPKPPIPEPRGTRPDPGPVSRRRQRTPPVAIPPPEDAVPYAELHAHSSYSFLDGTSSPEELLAEAERLGLTALALTDHDGFYGAARFADVAELMEVRLQTVFGAELSLDLPGPQRGSPDPAGEHLLVIARGMEGYHRLSGAITTAQLRGGEKGRPVYDLEELAASAGGDWTILTGCRKGAVRRGLEVGDAETPLRRLVDLFGSDHVAVELFDHGDPQDTRRNDTLAELAKKMRLPVVATNNVHYATPAQAPLAEAVAAVRAVRSMNELDGWLPAHGGAHLRSGAEMSARFQRYPGAISYGLELAAASAFPLRLARPALPQQKVPDCHTPMSWLRRLVWDAVPSKYPRLDEDGHRRIERELDVIEEKDFPGYFLIVHGIVAEARRLGILCQGRGSAAASAVCYLLGITAVDPILYRLPFERFLATTRQEEPDIDVDFDSRRREEIIQWVYREYGRERAAQVANVIQYRPKNAVRDMARALGHSPGQQDAWSRQVDGWSAGLEPADGHDIPENVLAYAGELLKAPRHLGIHSGGMVLTARPVGEVVPVEHARMENRTVIQWDKDDSAFMGLVKFDLLGLGMLAALQHCFDLIREATGEEWTLETLPKEEPGVYDMLCRADSIGVFQVESRAQIGLLPRLQPRSFYDLAIQIALIRPGPIQGGAVHPFVRRKMAKDRLDEENRERMARGEAPETFEIPYPHSDLEDILKRTLGIPIFQEQLIQMAMAVGDCTADEGDLLRRAMGSKRGLEKIEKVRDKLYAGMARRGLDAETSDRIYAQIQAFSNFGFAESHSLSFALLVYASSWLKLHYPAAFLAGLLRSQPMGFYSGATLTADARRHGVEVRRPDLHVSGATETLEPLTGAAERRPTGVDDCLVTPQPPTLRFDRDAPDESASHRRDGGYAVRLGLSGIRGIGVPLAEKIVAEREVNGRYRDLHDLVRRTDATAAQLEALATAGAFACLGLERREAIWLAGAAAEDRSRFLPGTTVSVQPPLFADQTSYEKLSADLWATGVSTDDHPMTHFRGALHARGVLTAENVKTHEAGRRIEVAGLVTHRQRPATAAGITFLNLEDESGLMNIVCSTGVWNRYRRVARDSPALIIRGILERSPEGVVNILADAFEDLRTGVTHRSRDFR
ncbi:MULTISPECIES: error-prone DNA polymerase [unclassified Microbacterium]|uniref:error-prone DNA polymerase n=1 Tax=unclassified Microbacterium TaxID=2609290 RepID=UPI000EA986A6|nr:MULTISPECIES: error-prone DNA polymerase [unclassified Microbacterium]MBT2486373.1 error-prone DNA polymerase [Microbacterium sp. ISL-108]RKN69081.1 DNA polymerase III subunit alpha [Microbacterium sp. CGR2]